MFPGKKEINPAPGWPQYKIFCGSRFSYTIDIIRCQIVCNDYLGTKVCFSKKNCVQQNSSPGWIE